jgi:chromosome segregation ATPase
MKSRIPLVILVVACVVLLAMFLTHRKRAIEESAQKDVVIVNHSNEWKKTSIALAEVNSEKQGLERKLATVSQEFSSLSNTFTTTTSRLAQTETALNKTQSTLAETEAALRLAETKINELEGQNEELDRQAAGLNQSINNLSSRIEETQRQLDIAQGDKALLQAELERLMAEKAELERQLNDLDLLREQISRLKSELAISRRLDWIRRGLLGGDMKGATRQMQSARESRTSSGTPASEQPQFNLNVEILDDGTVRVLPPGGEAPAPPDAPVPPE